MGGGCHESDYGRLCPSEVGIEVGNRVYVRAALVVLTDSVVGALVRKKCAALVVLMNSVVGALIMVGWRLSRE